MKNSIRPSNVIHDYKSLLPLVPLIVLIGGLEFLVTREWLPSFLVPSPSSVAKALFFNSEDLWRALRNTALCAFLGFLLSAAIGITLGILLSLSQWLQKAFLPYAVFFQTVPIIAIAPLLVIWFGYGAQTIIISSLIVAIFPMIASTLSGLRSTDLELVDLFKLYRASSLATLFKLRLPFALPQIFVGLRISAGLSVIGAIVGEFIAGGGIGGIIDVARTRQRVDQVFAALVLASVLGLIMVKSVDVMAKFYLGSWHSSERTQKPF